MSRHLHAHYLSTLSPSPFIAQALADGQLFLRILTASGRARSATPTREVREAAGLFGGSFSGSAASPARGCAQASVVCSPGARILQSSPVPSASSATRGGATGGMNDSIGVGSSKTPLRRDSPHLAASARRERFRAIERGLRARGIAQNNLEPIVAGGAVSFSTALTLLNVLRRQWTLSVPRRPRLLPPPLPPPTVSPRVHLTTHASSGGLGRRPARSAPLWYSETRLAQLPLADKEKAARRRLFGELKNGPPPSERAATVERAGQSEDEQARPHPSMQEVAAALTAATAAEREEGARGTNATISAGSAARACVTRSPSPVGAREEQPAAPDEKPSVVRDATARVAAGTKTTPMRLEVEAEAPAASLPRQLPAAAPDVVLPPPPPEAWLVTPTRLPTAEDYDDECEELASLVRSAARARCGASSAVVASSEGSGAPADLKELIRQVSHPIFPTCSYSIIPSITRFLHNPTEKRKHCCRRGRRCGRAWRVAALAWRLGRLWRGRRRQGSQQGGRRPPHQSLGRQRDRRRRRPGRRRPGRRRQVRCRRRRRGKRWRWRERRPR